MTRYALAVRYDSPGLGDILQGCHMVPWWCERYDEIYLSVPKPILELVRYSLAPYEKVKVAEHHPTGIGATETGWFTMLSQRGSFRPSGKPILVAPPGPAPRLAAERIHIGIAWASHWRDSVSHGQRGCGRSTSPDVLINPLLETFSNVTLHCLQPDRLEELKGYSVVPHQFRDFSDSARLVAALDCVVTVDAVAAHLCGGLGVPGFVLFSDHGASQYSGKPGNDGWWYGGQAGQSEWYSSLWLIRSHGGRTPKDPNGIRDAMDQLIQEIRRTLRSQSAERN